MSDRKTTKAVERTIPQSLQPLANEVKYRAERRRVDRLSCTLAQSYGDHDDRLSG